jgi:autotransporter-associated beta strand protein
MANQAIDLAPTAGQTLTIGDQIADQSGSDPTNSYRDPGAGTLSVGGIGTVVLGATNDFTGGIDLNSGTLDLAAAGAAGSGPIMFEPSPSPMLLFSVTDAPTNRIDNFTQRDTIEITGFVATGHTYVAGSLILDGSGGPVDLSLPGVNASDLQVNANTTTDTTTITSTQAPCYRRGTRILTERGEVAVEDLRVGDLVRTVLDAATAPIIWIGHRHVDCARHPQPRKVWPVRVAAGAFGPGQPHTDLFLSPDHAVYVNEVLIPAKHLINGSTITQVPTDRVTYYHLELQQHAVVLAQGLPTESFLDLKDGPDYANRAGPVRLYPDLTARMWEAFGCAPLIVTGPELAAARALVGRFATTQFAA